MTDLAEFQRNIGITFQAPSLLAMALIHSSFINESSSDTIESNERLEFLGDAILGLIIAEKLYGDFPDFSEGKMSRLRATLVSRDTLARVAQIIRLGDFLDMGKGEEASGGRGRAANLAGALEALIAAIYLDRGILGARDFVLRLFSKELVRVSHQGIDIDYKSKLQEVMQSKHQPSPSYRLVQEEGPDHDKRFTVEVLAGNVVLGRGRGKNKKLAQSDAARLALGRLHDSFTE